MEFASPSKIAKSEKSFTARKKIFEANSPRIENMHIAGYFYIMTNTHNTVLYCGATDDLYRRVQEHKNGVYRNSFTLRYNIHKLVYFEVFALVEDAFVREKQIKGGSRKKKIILIESINPEWNDLFKQLSSNSIEELISLKKFFR